MKFCNVAVAATILALASGAAGAATVIDQSNESGPIGFSAIHPGDVTEQTFTAGLSSSVGASIHLDLNGAEAAGNVTLSIWTGTVDDLAATMLASGTAFASAGDWAEVMWGEINLTVGQVYSLRASSDVNLIVDATSGFHYTAGDVFYNGVNYGTLGYDLDFRTYSNSGPAPEPASWALMLSGFAMVGGAMRNRTRAAVRL